jgi:predicted nucleic acid-binding protein
VDYLTVVYDSSVLYPAPLRDLLMNLAVTNLSAARWTQQIHNEWIRNVLKNRPDIKESQLERTRKFMDKSVRDCVITSYEFLIPTLTLPDLDDRHVLAAAIHGDAEIIVTMNLKDFPGSVLADYGIAAWHPDEFVSSLLEQAPETVMKAVKAQQENLKHPPQTMKQLLKTLEKQGLKTFVKSLKQIDL